MDANSTNLSAERGRPGGYTTGTSWKIWAYQTKDTQQQQTHCPSGTPSANPIPSTHTSILLPVLMATEQCWTWLLPEAPSSSSLLIHQPKLSLPFKQMTSELCALIAAFPRPSPQTLPALTHTDISTQLPPQAVVQTRRTMIYRVCFQSECVIMEFLNLPPVTSLLTKQEFG